MKRIPWLIVAVAPLVGSAAEAEVKDVEEIASGDYLMDPPGLDAPAVRTPRLRTQIYTDFTFASSPNLRALGGDQALIEGHADNYRFALGGSLKIRDFELDLEVPAVQVTRAHFDKTMLVNVAQDKIATSFGDVRFGAIYSTPLPYYPPKMLVGGGVRGRFPTHTTKYSFDSSDGRVDFVFPRFVHIEPTLLFATAFGPLTLLTDQGVIIMPGTSSDVDGLPIRFPGLTFWDAHYVVGLYFLDAFGLTFELNTVLELGAPAGYDQLSHIQATFVNPGIQIYVGGYKLDLAARIGLGDGADTFGVVSFAGRTSAMLRLTRSLDYDAVGLAGRR